MYDPSGDSLSLLSLESVASAAPSVYTKYSKGSKWSHAKPEPLSTDVTPTKKDQSSNTPTVEKTSQATQYDVPNTTQDLIEGVEQEQPVTLHSASYIPVPRPRLSFPENMYNELKARYQLADFIFNISKQYPKFVRCCNSCLKLLTCHLSHVKGLNMLLLFGKSLQS